MRKDQIFVLMLVILLPLTGCFDAAVGDAEGTDDAETNDSSINQPPVLHVTSIGINDSPNKISTYNSSTGEEETRMYYTTVQFWLTATDVDGTISVVGLDLDLDNEIDHEFTNNGSWDADFSFHESPGIAQSNGSLANYGQYDYGDRCFARLNLVAIDDDGAMTLIPYSVHLYHVNVVRYHPCLDDYAGYEE